MSGLRWLLVCQVTGRKFQKVLQDVPADSLELTIKEGKGKWHGKTGS